MARPTPVLLTLLLLLAASAASAALPWRTCAVKGAESNGTPPCSRSSTDSHALVLTGLATFEFSASSAWEEYVDGTARLTGVLTSIGAINGEHPSFDVEYKVGNRILRTELCTEGRPETFDTFSKCDVKELPDSCKPDSALWDVYPSFVSATMTGQEDTVSEGYSIELTPRGEPMAVGYGANDKNTRYGTSAWTYWRVLETSSANTLSALNAYTAGTHNGDWNLEIDCVDLPPDDVPLVPPSNVCVAYKDNPDLVPEDQRSCMGNSFQAVWLGQASSGEYKNYEWEAGSGVMTEYADGSLEVSGRLYLRSDSSHKFDSYFRWEGRKPMSECPTPASCRSHKELFCAPDSFFEAWYSYPVQTHGEMVGVDGTATEGSRIDFTRFSAAAGRGRSAGQKTFYEDGFSAWMTYVVSGDGVLGHSDGVTYQHSDINLGFVCPEEPPVEPPVVPPPVRVCEAVADNKVAGEECFSGGGGHVLHFGKAASAYKKYVWADGANETWLEYADGSVEMVGRLRAQSDASVQFDATFRWEGRINAELLCAGGAAEFTPDTGKCTLKREQSGAACQPTDEWDAYLHQAAGTLAGVDDTPTEGWTISFAMTGPPPGRGRGAGQKSDNDDGFSTWMTYTVESVGAGVVPAALATNFELDATYDHSDINIYVDECVGGGPPEEPPVVPPPGPHETCVLADFEGLAPGADGLYPVVTDQLAATLGLTVSALDGASVTAVDTADPQTPGALGLASPNSACGGLGVGAGGAPGSEGENCAARGIVLAVQGGTEQEPVDGSGTIVFEFASAARVVSVDVLDQPMNGGTVKLFYADGSLAHEVALEAPGANSFQRVELGYTNVARVEVSLPSGGAVDNLNYCLDSPELSADGCFKDRFTWTVAKEVSNASFLLFSGESTDEVYTVTYDRAGPVPEQYSVAGLFKWSVPPNGDGSPLTVASVTVTVGGAEVAATCASGDADVVPGSVLPGGSPVECTFFLSLLDEAPAPGGVPVEVTLAAVPGSATAGTSASATATFPDEACGEIDREARVVDDSAAAAFDPVAVGDGELPGFFNYTMPYTCGGEADFGGEDSYSHESTCTVTVRPKDMTDTTTVLASDDAGVGVECFLPSVAVTADASWNRTRSWTVTKSGVADVSGADGATALDGDGASVIDFATDADSATVTFTVAAVDDPSDGPNEVSGVVTVTNPHPESSLAVTVTVTVGGTAASVSCGSGGTASVEVLPGVPAVCDYWTAVADRDAGVVTAVATADAAVHPALDTPFESVDVAYNFASEPTEDDLLEVDLSDTVVDGERRFLVTVNGEDTPSENTRADTISFAAPKCDPGGGNGGTTVNDTIVNEARVRATAVDGGELLDKASWEVVVRAPCPRLSPTAECAASASFEREYPWTVNKTVEPASASLLSGTGQTATASYQVSAVKGEPVDTEHAVSGSVVVTDPHGTGATATLVTVTASLSPADGAAAAPAVSCAPGPLPVTCTVTDHPVSAAYAGDLVFSVVVNYNGVDSEPVRSSCTVPAGTPSVVRNDEVTVADPNTDAPAFDPVVTSVSVNVPFTGVKGCEPVVCKAGDGTPDCPCTAANAVATVSSYEATPAEVAGGAGAQVLDGGAGDLESLSLSYEPLSQTLTYAHSHAPGDGTALTPNAFWLVVNEGPEMSKPGSCPVDDVPLLPPTRACPSKFGDGGGAAARYSDTLDCQRPGNHAVTMGGLGGMKFDADGGRWEEFADGTGVLTGTLARGAERLDFEYRVARRIAGADLCTAGDTSTRPDNYVSDTADACELKRELWDTHASKSIGLCYVPSGPVDPGQWDAYLSVVSGTIRGRAGTGTAGLLVELAPRGPPLAVGQGASGKNVRWGASAWFTATVVSVGSGVTFGLAPGQTKTGDINVEIDCPTDTPPPEEPPLVGPTCPYPLQLAAGVSAGVSGFNWNVLHDNTPPTSLMSGAQLLKFDLSAENTATWSPSGGFSGPVLVDVRSNSGPDKGALVGQATLANVGGNPVEARTSDHVGGCLTFTWRDPAETRWPQPSAGPICFRARDECCSGEKPNRFRAPAAGEAPGHITLWGSSGYDAGSDSFGDSRTVGIDLRFSLVCPDSPPVEPPVVPPPPAIERECEATADGALSGARGTCKRGDAREAVFLAGLPAPASAGDDDARRFTFDESYNRVLEYDDGSVAVTGRLTSETGLKLNVYARLEGRVTHAQHQLCAAGEYVPETGDCGVRADLGSPCQRPADDFEYFLRLAGGAQLTGVPATATEGWTLALGMRGAAPTIGRGGGQRSYLNGVGFEFFYTVAAVGANAAALPGHAAGQTFEGALTVSLACPGDAPVPPVLPPGPAPKVCVAYAAERSPDGTCTRTGDGHALVLAGLGNFLFVDGSGRFTEHEDGTASVTGVLRSRSKIDGQHAEFSAVYRVGRRVDEPDMCEGGDETVPETGPGNCEAKLELWDSLDNKTVGGCYDADGPVDPSTWDMYLEVLDGSLIGLPGTVSEGYEIALRMRGPGLQFGLGAGGKNARPGASGWTFHEVVKFGAALPTLNLQRGSSFKGDWNLNVDCVPDEPPLVGATCPYPLQLSRGVSDGGVSGFNWNVLHDNTPPAGLMSGTSWLKFELSPDNTAGWTADGGFTAPVRIQVTSNKGGGAYGDKGSVVGNATLTNVAGNPVRAAGEINAGGCFRFAWDDPAETRWPQPSAGAFCFRAADECCTGGEKPNRYRAPAAGEAPGHLTLWGSTGYDAESNEFPARGGGIDLRFTLTCPDSPPVEPPVVPPPPSQECVPRPAGPLVAGEPCSSTSGGHVLWFSKASSAWRRLVFEDGLGRVLRFPDGSLEISGRLQSTNDASYKFDLHARFFAPVSESELCVDGRVPESGVCGTKLELGSSCQGAQSSEWEIFLGQTTGYLTGVPGTVTDGWLVSLEMLGPAPALGLGASQKSSRYGFSGWQSYEVLAEGPEPVPVFAGCSGSSCQADYNLEVQCEPDEGELPGGCPAVSSNPENDALFQERLAILYGDVGTGRLSAYVYSPADGPDSFATQPHLGTFEGAVTSGAGSGGAGSVETGFSVDLSAVNRPQLPGFPDFVGARTGDFVVGIWAHFFAGGAGVQYGDDGRVSGLSYTHAGYFDAADRDAPCDGYVCPPAGYDATCEAAVLSNDGDGTQELDRDSATFSVDCAVPTVTKTVEPSFTRTWSWTVSKAGDSSPDGEDSVSLARSALDLAYDAEETVEVTYKATVTSTPADSGHTLAGTVTVHNPSTEQSLTGLLAKDALGGTPLSCQNAAGMTATSVAPGETVTCTYSLAAPGGSADGTNTAEIWASGLYLRSGAVPFSFAGVTPDVVAGTAELFDSFRGASPSPVAGGALSASGTPQEVALPPRSFDLCPCDPMGGDKGTTIVCDDNTNVVSVRPAGSAGDSDSSSWNVEVSTACPDLESEVTCATTTSFTRTYDYNVTKTASPASSDLFVGADPVTVTFEVLVTREDEAVDSDFNVAGMVVVVDSTELGGTDSTVITDISASFTDAAAAGATLSFADFVCGDDGTAGAPYTIPAAEDRVACTFSKGVSGFVGGNLVVTTTVQALGQTDVADATCKVRFDRDAPNTEVNTEVVVSDTTNPSDPAFDPTTTSGSATPITFTMPYDCDAAPCVPGDDGALLVGATKRFSLDSPSGNSKAGAAELIEVEYDPVRQLYSYRHRLTAASGGGLHNGFWLVTSGGDNPKADKYQLVMFYVDLDENVVGAYVYDGKNGPNSYRGADAFIASFKDVLTVEDAADGSSREVSFTVPAAQLNSPPRPELAAEWVGVAVGDSLGIWMHPTLDTVFVYDEALAPAHRLKVPDNDVRSFRFSAQGWYDKEFIAAVGGGSPPDDALVCVPHTLDTCGVQVATTGGEVLDTAEVSVSVTCHSPTVSKTADTSFERSWDWTVAKSGSGPNPDDSDADGRCTTLGVDPEDAAMRVAYDVAVTAEPTNSKFRVWGDITVTNPHPTEALPLDVTDVYNDDALDVWCPETEVAAGGGSVVCNYTAEYAARPREGVRNRAEVRLNGVVITSEGVPVTFGSTPATKVREFATVGDAFNSSAEEGLATAGGVSTLQGEAMQATFDMAEYTRDFDALACSPTGSDGGNQISETYPNTATVRADDGQTDDASWKVTVQTQCPVLEPVVECELGSGFTRVFDWSINKTATPDSLDITFGDERPSSYLVQWEKEAVEDRDLFVTYSVTVTDPHDTGAMTVTGVTLDYKDARPDGAPETLPLGDDDCGEVDASTGVAVCDGTADALAKFDATVVATVEVSFDGIPSTVTSECSLAFAAEPTSTVNDEATITDVPPAEEPAGGFEPAFPDRNVTESGSLSYTMPHTCPKLCVMPERVAQVAGTRGRHSLARGRAVPAAPSLYHAGAYSLAFWVRPTGVDSTSHTNIFFHGAEKRGAGFGAFFLKGTTRLRFSSAYERTDKPGYYRNVNVDTAALEVGRWTHVVLTHSGSGATVFLDGVVAAVRTGAPAPSYIAGGSSWLSGARWSAAPAEVSDLLFSSRAMPADDIATIFEQEATGPDSDCVCDSAGAAGRLLVFEMRLAPGEERLPGSSSTAGSVTHAMVTYNPVTETLEWEHTVRETSSGERANGFWLVVNEGGNPKGETGELAIFYGDAATGQVTAYEYSGANSPNSWSSPGNFLARWPGALAVSDVGDHRHFHFSANVADINRPQDGLPCWRGALIGGAAGIWMHPTVGASFSYDAAGAITAYSKGKAGYLDTPGCATVKGALVCVPAVKVDECTSAVLSAETGERLDADSASVAITCAERDCGCDGGAADLRVRYTGEAAAEGGVTVTAAGGAVVSSFAGPVEPGAVLDVGPIPAGATSVRFDDGSLEAELDVTCGGGTGPGSRAGDFAVVSGHAADTGALLCPSCDCAGGVSSITFEYRGRRAGRVKVMGGRGARSILFMTDRMEHGQTFTVSGAAGEGAIGPLLRAWTVYGDMRIPADCATSVGPGSTFGGLYVLEAHDMAGNELCPNECGCEGGVASLALQFTGTAAAAFEARDADTDDVLLTLDEVVPGQRVEVTAAAAGGTLGSGVRLVVAGQSDETINTTCSSDNGPGTSTMSFRVLEGLSGGGQDLCEACTCGDGVRELTVMYKGALPGDLTLRDASGDIRTVSVWPGSRARFVKGRGAVFEGDSVTLSLATAGLAAVDLATFDVACGSEELAGPGARAGIPAGDDDSDAPEVVVISGKSAPFNAPLCRYEAPPGDDGLVPEPECACDVGLTTLSVRYNGMSARSIRVVGHGGVALNTPRVYSPGEVLTVSPERTGARLDFFVDNGDGTERRSRIHTRCRAGLRADVSFGQFTLLQGVSAAGARLCPTTQCDCAHGVSELTMRFNRGRHYPTAHVSVADGGVEIFDQTVTRYEQFDLLPAAGGSEFSGLLTMSITYNGDDDTKRTYNIDTSCRTPIGPGRGFYGVTIVSGRDSGEGDEELGRALCPVNPCGCGGLLHRIQLRLRSTHRDPVPVNVYALDNSTGTEVRVDIASETVQYSRDMVELLGPGLDGTLPPRLYFEGMGDDGADLPLDLDCANEMVACGLNFGPFRIFGGIAASNQWLCRVD